MMRIAVLAVASTLVFAACGGIGGGPRKVVVTEGVCNDVDLLRLNAGEVNRIVLDNSEHSSNQVGMTLRLVEFPILIRGELPPGTRVGTTFTTTSIQAQPGEEASIEVEPTFLGEYRAECDINLTRDNSQALVQRTRVFQIVD
jgi:hypothetical protein